MILEEKVTTAKWAIEQFVKDGESVVCGNYTQGIPTALLFEIIRQKKRGLTYYSQSGSIDADFLVAGKCLEKMICAYLTKWGGREGGTLLERCQRSGEVKVEDYGNFTYAARMAAGAYGYTFMPVMEAILDTDVFRIRDFMGEGKFGIVRCPFTNRDIPVVPAANPDTCVVHVQRADAYGNAQHWGGLGSTIHACLAAKKIIVSCEQIVDHSIIQASPHLTIIPGFKVNAVIEQPWGAHPNDLSGCYAYDRMIRSLFYKLTRTENGFKKWINEWVTGLPDHTAYIEKYISTYGYKQLESLRIKPMIPQQPDYGTAAESAWTKSGICRDLGVDRDRFNQLISERGDIVDVH